MLITLQIVKGYGKILQYGVYYYHYSLYKNLISTDYVENSLKLLKTKKAPFKNGAGACNAIRTHDLLFTRELLYRLSYTSV